MPNRASALLFAIAVIGATIPTWARETVIFTSPCTCEGNHGVERWAEKTDLSEPPTNRAEIRGTTPATIASWGAAGGDVERVGRKGLETLFFSVTGRVTKVKAEDDGDLHLSLEDVSKPGRMVVEIPLGDRWCELRKKVFSWSNTQFPIPGGKSVKLTHEPIVTVVGKPLYDGRHASGDNRRTYDEDLAAWEIHPVMEMTELAAAPAQSIAAPQPTATSSSARTPAVTAGPQQFVVLTQPVTIRIPYGTTVLQPGTKLQVISRDSQTVRALYMNEAYSIPIGLTDAH